MPRDTASSPPPADDAGWRLEHAYATLPASLHTAVEPTPVNAPRLVLFNAPLAISLGLDPAALENDTGAALFAGNILPPGASPLAQAYAGHQFGHFNQLGDGRALLLGEQRTPDGRLFDIQLKGPGPTPYSRRGDGRAALGPMLREYVISEAMHALGIPTTRSLAVAATGEDVWREAGALPGAVLTRVAASHVRVGTFAFAAAERDAAALGALIAHTLQRHYPDVAASEPANPALALLEAVIERQAALLAQWMAVGFVHGVMNTDNMALSGETIDYGPCAFLDAYDPETVFSSIDRQGRYAYGNQPTIALWNLTRLAESILPLIDPEETPAVTQATAALNLFPVRYDHHWLALHRKKLGLFTAEPTDEALIKDLLTWMQQNRADFTHTFATLDPDSTSHDADPVFAAWRKQWRARLDRQPDSAAESATLRAAHNPAVIPRNHLVESALDAATHGDLGELTALLAALATPYDHLHTPAAYRAPPPADAPPYRTFCGT